MIASLERSCSFLSIVWHLPLWALLTDSGQVAVVRRRLEETAQQAE